MPDDDDSLRLNETSGNHVASRCSVSCFPMSVQRWWRLNCSYGMITMKKNRSWWKIPQPAGRYTHTHTWAHKHKHINTPTPTHTHTKCNTRARTRTQQFKASIKKFVLFSLLWSLFSGKEVVCDLTEAFLQQRTKTPFQPTYIQCTVKLNAWHSIVSKSSIKRNERQWQFN